MSKEEKTNVMRVLDQKKVHYEFHSYEPDATMTGVRIASLLGETAAETKIALTKLKESITDE